MKSFVIGGGASGLTAAITAARNNEDVTIIEKNNKLGKKLLLTGNGRCNYFNTNMSLDNFYSSGNINRFINDDNINKVKSFFYSIGIIGKVKDGYYYPYSNTASAIHNLLLKEIDELNINIINEEVIDINNNDNKFFIKTNNNEYNCDKLILSTGGITYQKTGSDGFGYEILKKFNHTINPLKPALVPLVTKENLKKVSGIRIDAKLDLFVDKILVSTQIGEAQLTDYGISGICTMNVSRFINLDKENIIKIDFLPDFDELKEFIIQRNKKLKNRSIIELLEIIINYKLLYFIFEKLHINPDSKWDELSNEKQELIIKNIKEFELTIIDTKGLDFAQTTSGGVVLEEVKDNCESKLVKNLFITGELLDIDAICGGYNLTIAWITGLLAGDAHD